jgi:uncharacterized protein
MVLSDLTFIVTGDCNFNCAYCPQIKEKKTIHRETIEKAVNFFYPFFLNGDRNSIAFYGGEPLLAYEQVKQAVLMVEELNKRENKKIEFAVTTNGSLLTDERLDFFHRHRFHLVLSFDGLAQDRGRKPGSLEHMVRTVERSRDYPGIRLEINSVFSPLTITDFSPSLRFMIEPEGPEITFNISTMEEWGPADLETLETELARCSDFLLQYYRETGKIPIKNFQAQASTAHSGSFRCSAGNRRLTVSPEGDLWGCFLFYDYFKSRPDSPQYDDYHLGTLAEFMADYEAIYPEISARHADLRQDFFQVEGNFCFLCQDVAGCGICPVNAAYSSGSLGQISCRHCRLSKIQSQARQHFHQKLQELS